MLIVYQIVTRQKQQKKIESIISSAQNHLKVQIFKIQSKQSYQTLRNKQMGDVTSTCCQNTTHLQQIGNTREVNMDQSINEQVYTYEPFHELDDSIRETFQEAAESKYFRQPRNAISLDVRSNIWNSENIISIVKKYKVQQKSEKSSIFDMVSGTDSGRFCTYVKSLQVDNTVIDHGEISQEQPLPNSQSTNKTFSGVFLIYFPNKQYFLGHVQNNLPTNGILVFNPGCYYVGEVKNLTAEGEGRYQNRENSYIYEGCWSKNLQHGKGKEFYSLSKQTFEGQFMYGSKFGQGRYCFSDGRVYEGYFYNGHSDGEGKLTISPKEWYSGEWKLGSIQGKGEYHYPNGDVYYGEFQNGVKSGRGRYVFAVGYEYDGEWLEGKMHGMGVIKEGYDEIEGEWIEGKRVM